MPHFFSSSKSQRSLQRGNGMVDILGDGAQTLSSGADIPFKMMQFLLSATALMNQDLQGNEKIIQGFQLILSAIAISISITLLFRSEACTQLTLPSNTTSVGNLTSYNTFNHTNVTLCTLSLVANLLYKGVLLASWVPSEISKRPTADDAVDTSDQKIEV